MPEGTISFDEFKKMELRVGRITEVREHPNADKLYVIQIDVGGRTVQTCAGLKGYYSAEELQGKLVACVCNLAPAVLRGERSEAMMLAAQAGEKVVLLAPESDIAVGSTIL
jgi:methionyl-tRNA synthetase